MKKTVFGAALALVVAQQTSAAVLNLTPSDKSIEKISLAKAASATVEGRKYELTNVGSGLRTKKVVIANVDVYVAQLLVSDPAKYVRTDDGALDSVDKMKAAAIQMTFLRDVGGEKMMSSFEDTLSENKVDMQSAEIKTFLTAVKSSGEAKTGKSMTLVGEKLADGSEVITWENEGQKAQSVKGPKGFVKTIFAIWLGKPADSGLTKLKKALVEGGNG